jgi:hypothetical protein
MAGEQVRNARSESFQNRVKKMMEKQGSAWSGQQDLNLRQAFEISQGDSDRKGRSGGKGAPNRGTDSAPPAGVTREAFEQLVAACTRRAAPLLRIEPEPFPLPSDPLLAKLREGRR